MVVDGLNGSKSSNEAKLVKPVGISFSRFGTSLISLDRLAAGVSASGSGFGSFFTS